MEGKKVFTVYDTNAIKGIAILMMYIHHNFLSPARWGDCYVDFWPLTQNITVAIAVFFKICVSLFVFLTTYGLTVNYKHICNDNQKIYKFIINRIYKLLMNFSFIYILALLYSYLMGLEHYTKTYGNGYISVFKASIDFLGLAQLFGTPTANGTWWYMSLAIMIILVFPILYKVVKQYGYIAIILSWLLPIAINLPYSHFIRYLPCMFIGIFFAENDLLVKFRNKFLSVVFRKRVKLVCILTFLFIVLACLASGVRKVIGWKFMPFLNMLVAPSIIVYCYVVLKQTYLWSGLEFLGKHSLNMFLMHTFIRHYWYHDFIYSFKYAWIDTLVLIVITVILSMIIEWLKDITGYHKLIYYKF